MDVKELEKYISDEIRVGGYAAMRFMRRWTLVEIVRETPNYWVTSKGVSYRKPNGRRKGDYNSYDSFCIYPPTKDRVMQVACADLVGEIDTFEFSKLTLDQLIQVKDLLDTFKEQIDDSKKHRSREC